jgi:hypothetical protein
VQFGVWCCRNKLGRKLEHQLTPIKSCKRGIRCHFVKLKGKEVVQPLGAGNGIIRRRLKLSWLRRLILHGERLQTAHPNSLSHCVDKASLQSETPRMADHPSALNSLGTFILVDGEAVPEPDYLKWAQWMEDEGEERRRLAWDEVGGFYVSTIFLGLNHNWGAIFGEGGAPPVLWETMWNAGADRFSWEGPIRYTSQAEALAGHAKVMAALRAELH